MDAKRKALKEQYKTRKVTGGAYRITNRETGRFYLHMSDDLSGTRNWFRLCTSTGSCPLPAMQEDCKQYGSDAFELEELDHLEMGEDQTREQFMADLKVLLQLWSEKLPKDNRYKADRVRIIWRVSQL